MSNSIDVDRVWSDRYIPIISTVVGPHLMTPAPLWRDRNEAADLMTLAAKNVTIGVRMRRPNFAERYPYQFTLRAIRTSGTKTELDKVVDGLGDLMFYGHAAPGDEPALAAWMLLDLAALRSVFIRHPEILNEPGEGRGWMRPFPDGTQSMWFDARFLARDCPKLLVASYWPGVQATLDEMLA
jgi:hypothetical protein